MSVVGASDDWIDLLERMLPTILRLVVETWTGMPKPFSDDKEDQITELLCRALRNNRTVRDLPFYVQIQMVELDPAAGQELGRLDIAFLPTGLPGAPNESIWSCPVSVDGLALGSQAVIHRPRAGRLERYRARGPVGNRVLGIH